MECLSGAACECGKIQASQQRLKLDDVWQGALKQFLRLDSFLTPNEGVDLKPDRVRLWQGLVELYSQKAISFQKDRLVALSAVAQRLQRQ